MSESTITLRQPGRTSRDSAQRLMLIGQNRLELLMVELQEERERLLHALLPALGVTTFGLLAGLSHDRRHGHLFLAFLAGGRTLDIDRHLQRGGNVPRTAAEAPAARLADAFRFAGSTPQGPHLPRQPLRMNSPQTQKKLLIEENELSRVQPLGDAVTLTTRMRVMLDRTKSRGTTASGAAVLAAGIATFRHRHKGHVAKPSSVLPSVLNGAGLLFRLWSALRLSPRPQPQPLTPEQR